MATAAQLAPLSFAGLVPPQWSEPFVFPEISVRTIARCLSHGVALVVIGTAACGVPTRDGAAASRTGIVDDFGDTLRFSRPPQRIVSLNPGTTEALFAIGAGARVVGRTHWDVSPVQALAVTDLGDGIQPNVESILATRPDLVVLYASSSNRAAAAALHRAGVSTLSVHTDRIADFMKAVRLLGAVTGDTTAARVVADSVAASLAAVRAMPARGAAPTVFWPVWESPLFTIGAGSFLNELSEIAGAHNVFADLAQPSPQVTLESVAQRNPDFILAGPRSAVRFRTDARWRAVPAARDGRVLVFDTTLVGRPGVRMGEAARSLRALLDSAAAARRP